MPRRRKHPRLPNAFGSIRYIGAGRAKPYAVHPPCTDFSDTGYIRPKALCYVDDWYVGFAVLLAYRAGTYKPGDELTIADQRRGSDTAELDDFCRRLLSDYQARNREFVEEFRSAKTFAEVYAEFYEWKFGEFAAKKLSESSKATTKAAFNRCAEIHSRNIKLITVQELQTVVNNCKGSQATVELVVSLLKQLFRFAESRSYVDKNVAQHVIMPAMEGDEHGVPFTSEDVRHLWELRSDPVAEMLLIMCYTGMRITEYAKIDEINLDEWYLRGGIKTASGKNRIVPIHPAIRPLISERIQRDGVLITTSVTFRKKMHAFLDAHNFEQHTPHDCRHTFSALCERYGVHPADRKRMLGHSFGSDITDGVYGHRTLADLMAEIEKIPAPPEL